MICVFLMNSVKDQLVEQLFNLLDGTCIGWALVISSCEGRCNATYAKADRYQVIEFIVISSSSFI